MAHRADGDDGGEEQGHLVDWSTSVGIALVGALAAIGLILLFTALVDWVGDFWSQVIYFVAVFGVVIWLALRDRRRDAEDPTRLYRGASITPAGLPGPFVVTQALGVLAIAMLVAGLIIGEPRGLIWIGGAWVLLLVGAVGLVFWFAGLGGRALPRRAVHADDDR
jgi:hypothetical protein